MVGIRGLGLGAGGIEFGSRNAEVGIIRFRISDFGFGVDWVEGQSAYGVGQRVGGRGHEGGGPVFALRATTPQDASAGRWLKTDLEAAVVSEPVSGVRKVAGVSFSI